MLGNLFQLAWSILFTFTLQILHVWMWHIVFILPYTSEHLCFQIDGITVLWQSIHMCKHSSCKNIYQSLTAVCLNGFGIFCETVFKVCQLFYQRGMKVLVLHLHIWYQCLFLLKVYSSRFLSHWDWTYVSLIMITNLVQNLFAQLSFVIFGDVPI